MNKYCIPWLIATILGLSSIQSSAWAATGSLVQVGKSISGQYMHLHFKTNQAIQPRLQANGPLVVLEVPHTALGGQLGVILNLRTQLPAFLPPLHEVVISQSHPLHPNQPMIYLRLQFTKPVQAKISSHGSNAFDLSIGTLGATASQQSHPQSRPPQPTVPTALHWKVHRIMAKPGIEPLAEYRPVFGNDWRPLLTGQDISDNKQLRTGPGEQVILRQGKLQVQIQEETIVNLAGPDNNRLLLGQGMLAIDGETQSIKDYRFFGPGYYLISSDLGPTAFLMSSQFVVALSGQITIYQNNVLKVIPPGQYLDTQNLNTVPVTESLLQRLIPGQNPALEGWLRRYLNAL